MTSRDIKTINFVWATPDQLDDVWQLQEKSETSWPHPKWFFEESLKQERVLLAQDDKIPVAYLLYQVLWGNTAFLSLVKVLPDYQRNGVGTALVRLLEERLKNLGFKSYITSSETTNVKTRRPLLEDGFIDIGELKMAHGEELFYIKKLID